MLAELERGKWQEIKRMETEIKICVQVKHFLRERREITEKKICTANSRTDMVKKSSPLSPHNPFMDKEGLIRVGSRLINSDLTAEAKCPAILPKNDTNVMDLIKSVHRQEMHSGAKQVLCTLRQSVWILQGLQAVKKVITSCVHCQKLNQSPKGIMRSAVPLPCFIDVVKSQKVAGQ